MLLTVNVTDKHIADGQQYTSCDCPIALAMNDCDGVFDASIGRTSADCETADKRCFCGELPEQAQNFIRRFDGSAPVYPFSFQIEMKEY